MSLIRWTTLVVVGSLVGSLGPACQQSLALPPITKSGATIEISDWLQMPATLGGSARTRINFLREVPDGSNRLWVNDLEGPLYSVNKQTKQITQYLNLETIIQANGRNFQETGGLSAGFITFQFHPEFASNGKFYTVHLEDQQNASNVPAPTFSTVPNNQLDKQVVLTEWTTLNPASSTYVGTYGVNTRELIRVGTGGGANSRHEHPMGDLQFNPVAKPGDPDYGLMYISQGDFGISRDTNLLPLLQTPGSVFGSTLRIDPLGNNSANGKYGIPSDNPWASDDNPNTLGEVWTYGHRNAHRLYWDPEDGRLYNFDVGSDTTGSSFEEINVVEGGSNYGWPLREGTFAKASPEGLASALPANDNTLGFSYPVAQFGDNEGNAIAGGVAYRGVDPALNGKMIFGDIVTGRLFYSSLNDVIVADNDDSFNVAGNPQIPTAAISELTVIHNGVQKNGGLREIVQGITGNNRVDLRFGWDLDQEIYILTKTDGWIRRLEVVPIEGDFDKDLDVDGDDFLLWQRTLGTTVMRSSGADANANGVVDAADLAVWRSNYGQSAAVPSGLPVPEPASSLLVLCGLIAVSARIRRHALR